MRHTMIAWMAAIAAWVACGAAAMGQISYENTSGKANRFFAHGEWASAAATYTLMLHERPDVADTYGRAIVACEMMDDSARSMQLLDQAIDNRLPLDSLLSKVKEYSFVVGKVNMYENFMLDAAAHNPWMARPIDAYLLDYYVFRDNGPQIIAYAKKMLANAPRNVGFLQQLAQGYMLTSQGPLAADTWKKILEIEPDCYTAILNLANYYYLNADNPQALAYFQQAKALRSTPYVDAKIRELSAF